MGSFSLNDVFSSTGTPVCWLKRADQRPVARIALAADRLQPARAIDVRDRRDDVALLGAHRIDLDHERIVHGADEVLVDRFGEHRRRERPEPLAELDLLVDDVAHVAAPRIGEDAAIAERARAPFHAALEPADDVAVGQLARPSPGTAPSSSSIVVHVHRPCSTTPLSRITAAIASASYSVPQYECSMRVPTGRSPVACHASSAAPSAVPLSPAAGWMNTFLNGVLLRILPLATLFIAQPPARHSAVERNARVHAAQHVKGAPLRTRAAPMRRGLRGGLSTGSIGRASPDRADRSSCSV